MVKLYQSEGSGPGKGVDRILGVVEVRLLWTISVFYFMNVLMRYALSAQPVFFWFGFLAVHFALFFLHSAIRGLLG